MINCGVDCQIRQGVICSRFVDVVERWSKRIAERVAPAEADFAQDVGAAYAAGGQARKGLLSRPSVRPGAFGLATCAGDLPLILRALADAGNALLSLLRSPYLNNALAAGSLVVALRSAPGREREPTSGRPATKPGTEPKAPSAPPTSERQAVEQAFASLRDRLMAAGFTQERARQLACELLQELLDDTAEAALFIDALSAVPDGRMRLKASKKKEARKNSRHW